MDTQAIIISVMFIIGITAIALEHNVSINKSWIAIITGSLMWMVLAMGEDPMELNKAIHEGSEEIFGLIIFLMGAMTIVEMLAHFRFFEWIQAKVMRLDISNKALFWILGLITFFASAILDNLTCTLVMINIGRHLYKKRENFVIFTINTVIAANAGGAMSPVGDVTTIMLWLASKFTAWQIMLHGILPSLMAWVIPQAMLTMQLHHVDLKEMEKAEVPHLKWHIIVLGLSTFACAVMVNVVNLPPFIGILLGLGVAASVVDLGLKKGTIETTANRMVHVIKTIDMATIIYFVGILLAVDALAHHGVLDDIAHLIFGSTPGSDPKLIVVGNTALGIISSILDNVPLTAAAMDMLPNTVHYQYWILLALTAGTGGSMLVIGSAAGVAAMGQVPQLTFVEYLKKGTIPALLGYFAAIGTWWLQFFLH